MVECCRVVKVALRLKYLPWVTIIKHRISQAKQVDF